MDNKVFFTAIANQWALRREGVGLKPGTKKEKDAQLHFAIGAVQAAKVFGQHNQGMDATLVLALAMGGRCLVKEYGTLPVPA